MPCCAQRICHEKNQRHPALSALALTACGSGGTSGSSQSGGDSPILIGEVAGTAGAYGTTGQAMVNGARTSTPRAAP
jgi:hypothetical protein